MVDLKMLLSVNAKVLLKYLTSVWLAPESVISFVMSRSTFQLLGDKQVHPGIPEGCLKPLEGCS